MIDISGILRRALNFQTEAKQILMRHETSAARIITLEETYSKLEKLSLGQDALFREGLGCLEHKFFCAAHVLSWAGFMDFLEEKFAEDGFAKLKKARPRWKVKSIEDVRVRSEFQLVEAAKLVGIIYKGEEKALKGLLIRRNECAHPSPYSPGLNETLGFVSEVLNRLETIQSRTANK